ncbi:MAG: hypothetical protein IJW86_07855 [Clostridia bacterium]|nr:hypothetical protein [Clostridia bacterium]
MKEKEKYVGNTVREENRRKKVRYSAVTLILLLVLVVVLIATGAVERMTDTENLSKEFAEFIGTEIEQAGFPVSFSTNDIKDVKAKGSELYVLTEKFITPINKKGEIGQAQQITYAEPAIKTNDNYAIVFDRLSNKYTVIDKKGNAQARQDENGSRIFDAVITEKGEVMLSLSSTSSSSILHIMDKKGEDLLIWSCANEYIVSFDMSGDRVYCAAIGAYGGEAYTKLYVLEIGQEEPVCEYTLHGSACIKLRHISSDKFSVLCDDALYICNAKKDETVSKKITFDSKMLFYAADSQGNTAVVFDDKENFAKDLLSVYSTDADVFYSISVDENIIDLSLEGKEVFLLYDDGIKTVTSGGKAGQQLSFTGKCKGVVTAGKKIYCYSLGGVEKAQSE